MDWTRICKSLPMIFLLTSLICACGNDEEKQEAETEKTEVQTIPTKEQVLGEIKTSGDLVIRRQEMHCSAGNKHQVRL